MNTPLVSEMKDGLYGVVIRQDIKDSMLSLSDLQEAYKRARVQNNWKDKGTIQSIISYKENCERIYYLLKENDKIKDFNFWSSVENVGVIKTLKKLGLYKCYGRGSNKIVFCDSNIWLLICQELNSRFYADVINYLFTGKSNYFDFVAFDAAEYEETQKTRINHENAWKYFYPEGKGKAKEGYHLHHINPDWRYNDIQRYNEWNVEDLVMVTVAEHFKIHQNIGFGKSKSIERSEALVIGNTLRLALLNNINTPNYSEINKALNKKVFGKHETGIRNTGSQDQLKQLTRIEDNIAYCINKGFYKTNEDILKAIEEFDCHEKIA